VALALAALGCSAPEEAVQGADDALATYQSQLEINKAISARINEEVVTQGNLALADEILAAGYVDHDAPPELSPGVEGFKEQIILYRTAFPDLRIVTEDMIAEGDKVVTRWTAHGTHQGELRGLAPTGKQVTVKGIAIDRIVDGKIVEHWDVFDQLGMMQQLEAASEQE
jgi:steroid delta-isomerase-like uncharacterized protein